MKTAINKIDTEIANIDVISFFLSTGLADLNIRNIMRGAKIINKIPLTSKPMLVTYLF
jgi:hypothetical protein